MARRRVGVRDRIAGETAACQQSEQGQEPMDTPAVAGYAASWTFEISGSLFPLVSIEVWS